MSPGGRAAAGLLTVIALVVLSTLAMPASARMLGGPGHGAEPRVNRSCGSVLVQHSVTYELKIVTGSPSCDTVRRIAKKYGHPTGKPKFYCSQKGYECEYSHYPEGWRCGGLFQGTFQCWHGANSPLRASEVFDATGRVPARALARKVRRGKEKGAPTLAQGAVRSNTID